MTKTTFILALLIFGFTNCFSQLSKKEFEGVVAYFVDCVKKADIDQLDLMISYPLQRAYPIPPINNKEEFKNRYSEIFDDSLTSVITNSNLKKDWTDVGGRGIMLHNGMVWIDYEGRLLTTNYTSAKEKALKEKWIAYEKALLNTDLKAFKIPIHTIETDAFIIRIDLLENQMYRYASWSSNSKLSDPPDLVIKNGKRIFEGSGGNHHFEFTKGEYNYTVYVDVLGLDPDEMSPFQLIVTKEKKEILNQFGKKKQLR